MSERTSVVSHISRKTSEMWGPAFVTESALVKIKTGGFLIRPFVRQGLAECSYRY